MRLWQGFVSNLSSALLALFLAVVVWVVAVYETAPPQTDLFPSPLSISVLNLGDSLTISNNVPRETRITVRALGDTWDELSTSDFEATIDLAGLGAGAHDVPVNVTTDKEDVSILALDPATISVDLQELAERKVRVRVKLLDEESIPLGYTFRLPVATPEQVTVTGPKDSTEMVAEAVVEVSLRNARDTVAQQLAPTLLNTDGDRVGGLSVSPPTVAVRVVVERQVGYRDVTVRATTEGSPASGYWISNISVEPVLVTVYGQQSQIEALPGFLDTEPIDVQGATNDIIRRVPLALPEGVLVLGEGSGDEGILVQISIQPLLGGQTIRSELELRQLSFGLTATASPTAVDIILSGPLPALQELQPSDVRTVLNLLGLTRGTHKVTPEVILPEGLGLEVQSIVPDIVEVTVQ
jgi:YbbR domain-containing protein